MGSLRVPGPRGNREGVEFRMEKGGDMPAFEKRRKQQCFKTMEKSFGGQQIYLRGFSQVLHLVGGLLQVWPGVALGAESRRRFETTTG